MFPNNDSRYINVILINLPAKLASHVKNSCGVDNIVTGVQRLTEQEKGPLRYIARAVISKLYRKMKKVITQIQSCKIFCFRCAFPVS